jgi:hypothetical protein
VLTAFVVSRVAYAIAGVRFSTDPLDHAVQLIDLPLLRHDFWTSIWYLHTQPPLYNVFVGFLIHLPMRTSVSFHAAYLGMGAGLAVVMFLLMRELAVPPGSAAVLTSLFMVAPATVLYENYLFYTYPVALLLCATALFLARYLMTSSPRYGLACFGCAAALVLTRATYHVLWLVGMITLIALAARIPPRKLAAIALLPLVVAGGWLVKNWLQFGTPSTSSMLGTNLAKLVLVQAPRGDLEELVRDGELSPQALIPPASPPNQYAPLPERTGIAVLDRPWKQDARNGLNLNHRVYPDVSQRYFDDSVAYIRSNPRRYAHLYYASLRFYWIPSSDYSFVEENRKQVAELDEFVNRYLYWQPDRYQAKAFVLPGRPGVLDYAPSHDEMAWGIVLMYLATFGVAPWVAWRAVRRPHEDSVTTVTLLFLSLTTVYVTLVSNAFEIGENNRFRFEVDPAVWVVVAVLVTRLAAATSHVAGHLLTGRGKGVDRAANANA